MPKHLITRINPDKLYPPFFRRYLALLAVCEARGAAYYAVSGFRDPKEQDAKYAQGRTTPGPKITNARGGQSTHNYGIATDSAYDGDPNKPGLQPNWNKGYEILAEEGAKFGLQVGVPGLIDPGHVQLPLTARLKRTEKSVLLELRGVYLGAGAGGLAAVWKKLDSWGFDS